ncbi:MAG: V-type ATP synthase subunit I [Angelakisella sp.]|jgi:V/A-type H+-transporting ATPase subunit I|nr:V-type ATP synthase subunit I [Angelakisella sp.]
MIEKMERVFLCGLAKDSEEIISRLMKAGCVQLSDPAAMSGYEEIKDQVELRAADVYEKEQTLSRLGQCVKSLAPYGKKKGLLDKRREVGFGEVLRQETPKDALEICRKVEELQKETGACKSRISQEEFLQASLAPWRELDLPLEVTGTESSRVLLAAVPVTVTVEELERQQQEQQLGAYYSVVSEDKDQRYIVAVAHKDNVAALGELLRQAGATSIAFDGLSGTASENIAASKERVKAEEASIQALKDQLSAYGERLPEVQLAWDSTQVSIDCGKAEQNLLQTQETFVTQGWVPQRQKGKVEKALSGYTCYFQFQEAGPDEDPPVLLKNNKFVEPFEAVTEMYALPAPHSLDPNPFMAPFFFVFFGMMLSDAGYGLVLAILGLWGAKNLDMGPGGKKLLKMLGYCGISTVFWGAFYGSWFGDTIPKVTEVFFGNRVQVPMLLDPLTNPMPILIMAFVVGYIHILVGLGLKAYLMIRRGHSIDALFDVGFWYFVLVGLVIFAGGQMVIGSAVMASIGKWLAIAGAVGLVLTQGRDKKNPIMKLANGVLSLYDITGYFSDLLSYSRIMALGLATGVIAQVVNTMGTLPGANIIGVVVFVAVFLLGHVLNLAINALGSYVHTSRLQYVEFFGKFFEGGGQPFRPLKAATKYVSVIDQEE